MTNPSHGSKPPPPAQVVDLGDNFFQLELLDNNFPKEISTNGQTWVYDGQAIFDIPNTSQRPTPYREWIEPDISSDPGEVAEALIGTQRIDAAGRVWILSHLDQWRIDQIQQATPDYDYPSLAPASEKATGYWEEGVEIPLHTSYDCDSNNEDDMWIEGSESRNLVPDPMNSRQRKIVLISVSVSGGYLPCSGVMVDTNTLLTAAHCVEGYYAYQMDVCTYGNYQSSADCWTVPAYDLPADYIYSGGALKHDYALIHIGSNQNAGVGWMAISSASKSTLESVDHYSVGYPATVNTTCDDTATSPVNSDPPYALYGYWQNAGTANLTANLIKTDADATGGQSGSPFFYYPSGGGHYVTGVMSKYRNPWFGADYVGGPNHDQVRQFVQNNK